MISSRTHLGIARRVVQMVGLCKQRRQNILISSRLNVVGAELLEVLPVVENTKTFWLLRYSLIKLT